MPTKDKIQTKHILSILGALLICIVFLESTNILQAAAPTVRTMPAVNITKTSATLAGVVSDDGGQLITASGFEFGLTSSYGQSVGGDPTYRQTDEFGGTGSANGQLDEPMGIDLDSNGDIFVADRINNRIQKFNGTTHAWMQNIGTPGTDPEQLEDPLSIVLLSDDSMWVVDRANGSQNSGSLIKYDASGTFVECITLNQCATNFDFGNTLFASNFNGGIETDSSDNLYYTKGNEVYAIANGTNATIFVKGAAASSADGEFDSPAGLFVDSVGNILVADKNNGRIQKLESDGDYLSKFGTVGSGDGEFQTPAAITSDSTGDLFVVDAGNGRIQKFDSNGNFILDFGSVGQGDDQFAGPVEIVADAADDLYISDSQNDRIVKYEQGFTSDLSVVLPSLTCGTTYHYRAYATNSDGTSYGLDETFSTLDCDVPLVRTGVSSSITASSVTLAGTHEDVGSLSMTSRGFHYGTTASYGQSVSEDGDLYIDSFGSAGGGGGNGTFLSLYGVGSDAEGNIYTTDSFENIIQKFSATGTFISQYDVSFPDPGGVTTPYVLRGAPDGKLYAVDAFNSQIIKFDDNNFTNPTVFAAGAGLSFPTDIAFDASSNIYAVDSGNSRVVKLDQTGSIVLEIDNPNGGPDFAALQTIAVNSGGDIFVYDGSTLQIHKFDSTGAYVTSTSGVNGSADGQFAGSAYLASDGSYIYAADGASTRVQKFDSDLDFVSKFGSTGASIGQFASITGITLGNSGDIIVADSGNSRIQIFNERFSLPLVGLTCGTTYHYEAFATSPDGTGDGDDATFTTSACPPSTGGGGGTTGSRYYCNDPLATNYTENVPSNRVDNDLCKYPEPDDDELACTGTLFLSKPVRYGYANNPEDVKLLERFLNTYENTTLTVDGVYAHNDYVAVVTWQEKYASEILKPWGLTKGTGYVFITSLRKIQKVHDTGCAETERLKRDFCYIYDQKLKRGDNIPLVKFAQKALRAAGTFSGTIDGVYGPVTESSVRSFQTQNGLAGDGVLGATTGLKLEEVTCNI